MDRKYFATSAFPAVSGSPSKRRKHCGFLESGRIANQDSRAPIVSGHSGQPRSISVFSRGSSMTPLAIAALAIFNGSRSMSSFWNAQLIPRRIADRILIPHSFRIAWMSGAVKSISPRARRYRLATFLDGFLNVEPKSTSSISFACRSHLKADLIRVASFPHATGLFRAA